MQARDSDLCFTPCLYVILPVIVTLKGPTEENINRANALSCNSLNHLRKVKHIQTTYEVTRIFSSLLIPLVWLSYCGVVATIFISQNISSGQYQHYLANAGSPAVGWEVLLPFQWCFFPGFSYTLLAALSQL